MMSSEQNFLNPMFYADLRADIRLDLTKDSLK